MVILSIQPCSLKRWDRALETFPFRFQQDQITSYCLLKMIHSLTQADHRLLHPLGRYIGAPHRPDVWFLCETLGSHFLKVDLGGHDVYTLNQTARSTRYGTTYLLTSQHSPIFGVTTHDHHQLAGLHRKTSLIVSCLVPTTRLRSKSITGNPSIMGKSIPLEISQDQWQRR